MITEKEIPNNDERLSFYLNNGPTKQELKDAEVKLGRIGIDDFKQLRVLAKNDVFFLGNTILGYNDLSPNLHGHVSTWMMKTRRERFRELLLPRSHYKTTVWTISDSIRIGLPDDLDLGIWPECLGPNCRILIGHEVVESAAGFLVSIAGHFLSNAMLRLLFPEVVPSKLKQRINKYQLELPRQALWNEPTYGTIGVGGRSQGWHYNFLKLDDLIGDKARDSRTEMENAINWFDNIQSFFVEFDRDHLDVAGTRWAPKDLYWHYDKTYGQKLKAYIRPAEEYNKVTGKLEPIFPEKFSSENFEILKKKPLIWAAQYANNPEVYGREFLAHWKRYYKWIKYPQRLIAYKGQSDEVDMQEIHDVSALDRCILIDPAMSGDSGIIVTGGAPGRKQFVLEAIKFAFKPPELVELLFQLVIKWKPRVVVIEEVLFSGLFEPWLLREMQARQIYFAVRTLKVGTKAKEARIRGLSNYYSDGKIFHTRQQTSLEEEYDSFSGSADVENMHLLDALSQGPQGIWMQPLSQQQRKSLQEYEEMLIGERDSQTGY